MNVEFGSTSKTLSQKLSTFLDCEVFAESAEEQISCIVKEEMCSAVTILNMVGRSSHERLGNSFVAWREGIAEV